MTINITSDPVVTAVLRLTCSSLVDIEQVLLSGLPAVPVG